MLEHLKGELEALIASKYTHADGRPWAEIPMAKAIGISQSQLNAIRHGKNAGANALIALSRQTGKSINELLGMAPTVERGALVEKVSELVAQLERFGFGEKHVRIPVLMNEIRALVGTLPKASSAAEYQAQVRDLAGKKRKRTASEAVLPLAHEKKRTAI